MVCVASPLYRARHILCLPRLFSSVLPTKTHSPTTFVHKRAVIIGDVELSSGVSIWPNAVLRGDVNKIFVGTNSNIQDNVVIHCTGDWTGPGSGASTKIGSGVSIGHMAMLHGCTVENNVLIGMRAIVMDGAVIPSDVIIGAGSLVPPNKILTSQGLYVGSPIKRVRDLTSDELQWIRKNALRYVTLMQRYMNGDPETQEHIFHCS